MILYRNELAHAADLLQGCIDHPWWYLEDEALLIQFVAQLRGSERRIEIAPQAAAVASNMIQGFIDHPWWKGLQRDALTRVVSAINTGVIEICLPMPSFAIPGETVIFTARGGSSFEIEEAMKVFDMDSLHEVGSISIGRSSSRYKLVGNDREWDSCLFDFADVDAAMNETDEERARRDAIVQQSFDFIYPSIPFTSKG